MRPPLKIAVAQPAGATGNIRANALEHARLIRSAQARVVAFPELSLTGYDLDAAPVSLDDGALDPIKRACAGAGAVALVGAPVEATRGDSYIAMLRVSEADCDVVYLKSHLGGDEPARFAAGNGAATTEVDGWRIGLGICKDAGVDQHVAEIAALHVDAYVAGLVHRPDELDLQEERGVRIARTCQAYVAFASFAGPTGGGYDRTAGISSIWARDGTPLARAGAEPGDVATAWLT